MRRPTPAEVPGLLRELASAARELAEVAESQPPKLSAKALGRAGYGAATALDLLRAALERAGRQHPGDGADDDSGVQGCPP